MEHIKLMEKIAIEQGFTADRYYTAAQSMAKGNARNRLPPGYWVGASNLGL